jgi:beta-glucosidase
MAYLMYAVQMIRAYFSFFILAKFISPCAFASELTIKEQLGQVTQPDVRWITPEQVRDYNIGSVLRGGGTLFGHETDALLEANRAYNWAYLIQSYKLAARNSTTKIPLLFAIDAVHGHSNVTGATLFPHNIGLGAANDLKLMRKIGLATAWEVFVTGVDWNFSPTMAIARNENWGRTYESFSEDTSLVTALSSAYLNGLQSELIPGHKIIGTAKHWLGDGGTTNGIDQGNTELPFAELMAQHVPPYVSAIQSGVQTVMVSFNSISGKKVHGSRELVQGLLREKLGFNGVVITDWNGIDQIETPPDLKGDDKYMFQIAVAFDAGIDVFMVPENWKKFIELSEKLVENYYRGASPFIHPNRLREAVSRILKLKNKNNLAIKPLPLVLYKKYNKVFGSRTHRDLANEAARKSAVLLKSNLKKIIRKNDKVLVLGELAVNTGYQAGGWSLEWQGVKRNIPGSLSIYDGLKLESSKLKLKYSPDGLTNYRPTKVVVVVGEDPYAEGAGDRWPQGPELSEAHVNLVRKAQSFGVPVIVVLLSGRPLLLTKEVINADVLISYWLPGTMGSALAELLTGKFMFTGRLPFSWPRSLEQIDFDYREKNLWWLFPFAADTNIK